MDIATVRDYVISILGCITIILVLGLTVFLFIAWRKINRLIIRVNKTVASVNYTLLPVYRWLCVIRNFVSGLDQSLKFFKKGGG
jgi:hypothetical protein